MKHEVLEGGRAGGATRSAMAQGPLLEVRHPFFISPQSIGHTGTSNRGFVFLGDSSLLNLLSSVLTPGRGSLPLQR